MAKIFISWSGETAKAFGEQLALWLGDVMQGVECFFSPADIEMGAQWFSTIQSRLADHSIGIICLTPDNLRDPWILFEAGALYKGMQDAMLCSVLIGGLEKSSVTPPLSQFQMATLTRPEMEKLVKDINARLQSPVDGPRLERAIERSWADFERSLLALPSSKKPAEKVERPAGEVLGEVLETVRQLQREFAEAKSAMVAPVPESKVAHLYRDDRTLRYPPLDDRWASSAHLKAPRVRVRNDISEHDIGAASGKIFVEVLSFTKEAVVRVDFNPPLGFLPLPKLHLVTAPGDEPDESISISIDDISAASFLLRIRSKDGDLIPRGTYVFLADLEPVLR